MLPPAARPPPARSPAPDAARTRAVLHLTRDLPPSAQGGVSIAVGGLRAALGRHGVAQAVLSFDAWRPLKAGAALQAPAPATVDDDGLGPIVRLSRPAQLDDALAFAVAWLQRWPQATLLCHADLLFPVATQLRDACAAVAQPPPRRVLVAHVVQRAQRLVHGLDAPTASELAQHDALLAAELAIAPSPWAARQLWAVAPQAAIEVAPPLGLAGDAAMAADAGAGPHLVYLGRFDAIKGFDVLLAALPAVLAALPGLRVTLAGGLPLAQKGESRWHKRIDASLGSVDGWRARVDLPGFLGHADALRLLATADVVVVPSRIETFGQVVTEAMALGRCVVAADGGALGERLRSEIDALVVPAGDADALGDALLRALGDAPLQARLGEAARQAQRAQPDPISAWLPLL